MRNAQGEIRRKEPRRESVRCRMEITKETKLSDLLGQYPWLKEELSKVNDKFKMALLLTLE